MNNDDDHQSDQSNRNTDRPSLTDKVDPGLVEVSIALAGIAIAMAAFLPGVRSLSKELQVLVAILTGIMATSSTYTALWLLAQYCQKGKSPNGFKEILALLGDFSLGPYWLLAISLLIWLVLGTLISGISLVR